MAGRHECSLTYLHERQADTGMMMREKVWPVLYVGFLYTYIFGVQVAYICLYVVYPLKLLTVETREIE